MVNAVDERSSRTPTPSVAAVAHARMPTATPRADIVEARGPPVSALRMIRAVSGPGVAMISAESATHARKRPSSSMDELWLGGWFRAREQPDDVGVVGR